MRYLVGRDPSCSLPLTHSSVSWEHAELEWCDGSWLVRDRQSTNGTWVEGRRVAEIFLPPGAMVRFGSHEVTLPSAPTSSAASEAGVAVGFVPPPADAVPAPVEPREDPGLVPGDIELGRQDSRRRDQPPQRVTVRVHRCSTLIWEDVLRDEGGIVAQVALCASAAALRPDLVEVFAIDLHTFGMSTRVLHECFPSMTVATTPEAARKILELVLARMRTNIGNLGWQDASLADRNRAHPQSASPYLFLFLNGGVGPPRSDLSQAFASLLASEVAAKAGVHIFVQESLGLERAWTRVRASGAKIRIENDAGRVPGKRFAITVAREFVGDKVVGPTTGALAPDMLEVTGLSDRLSRVRRNDHRPVVQNPYPDPSRQWSELSTHGLKVPVGRKGEDIVHVELGGGSVGFNGLVGGSVGTGKTVLLHEILLQAACRYSPDELALSILDYKEGAEFSAYRDLPHIYALSVGPGSDFGVAVLRGFKAIMSERGRLFKEQGVRDLMDYRNKTGEPMARHLLVIDEFQVLLRGQREAPSLLDDILRRGRSAGLHVILSSQSLADGLLDAASLGQLGVRMCLRLSPSESARFLGGQNDLPSRFTLPGQAVLNNREGAAEANQPFQVSFHSNEELRACITNLARGISRSRGFLAPPFVYDDARAVALVPEMIRERATRTNTAFVWGLSIEVPPSLVSTQSSDRVIAVVGKSQQREALEAIMVETAEMAGKQVARFNIDDLRGGAASDTNKSDIAIVECPRCTFADVDNLQAFIAAREGMTLLSFLDARILPSSAFRERLLIAEEGAYEALSGYERAPQLRGGAVAAYRDAERGTVFFRIRQLSRLVENPSP